MEEKKKGQFTNQVNLPEDVGDEEKKALKQTGEDATSGW